MSTSKGKKGSSISRAETAGGIAEFWDANSLDDRWDEGREVSFEIRAQRRHRVTLDPMVFARLAKEAQVRGIATETLINLWLSERLQAAGTTDAPDSPSAPLLPAGSPGR